MPVLDELEADRRPAVLSLVTRLKHDLGKYVAFQARWLADDASEAERVQALRDDLLATRRGPEGSEDAVSVWTPYAEALTGTRPLDDGELVDLAADPDVQRLTLAMDRVRATLERLRAGAVPSAAVQEGLTAARDVAAACRDLHRRAREASRNG